MKWPFHNNKQMVNEPDFIIYDVVMCWTIDKFVTSTSFDWSNSNNAVTTWFFKTLYRYCARSSKFCAFRPNDRLLLYSLHHEVWQCSRSAGRSPLREGVGSYFVLLASCDGGVNYPNCRKECDLSGSKIESLMTNSFALNIVQLQKIIQNGQLVFSPINKSWCIFAWKLCYLLQSLVSCVWRNSSAKLWRL